MKVALIGGTGFVGSYLVDELVAHGHQPHLLVRPGSEQRVRHADSCSIVTGEVQSEDAVREVLADCDAAIYNIGILRERRRQGITFQALQYEGAVRAIDLAGEMGVRRFLLMSANGVKADGTHYQRTKYKAEEHLHASGLEYTVFRPSVIFGDPRGCMEFCTQLRDDMIRMPLPAPLFYEGLLPRAPGSFALSPVHIGDVARAFVDSLEHPDTHGQTYPLCGPEAISWKQIIGTIATACGRRKLTVPIPAFYVKTIAALLERLEILPVTPDQITMLLEGSTCDSAAAFDLLGIEPVRFEEATLRYLRNG